MRTAYQIVVCAGIAVAIYDGQLSIFGLKIATCCLAICARRIRRMSSSVFPLNMHPTITSIQPLFFGES